MSDRAEAIRLYNRGLTRAKAGELEEAKGLLEASLRKDPGHVTTYVVLGKLLAQQGDDEGAVLLWQAALRLDPLDRIARECLARLRSPSPMSRVKRFAPSAVLLIVLPLLVWIAGSNLRVQPEIRRLEIRLSELTMSGTNSPEEVPLTASDDREKNPTEPSLVSPDSANLAIRQRHPLPPISAKEVDALYRQALEDHRRGRHETAIVGFERVLDRPGPHPLKDNAQYWIGESYLAQENYRAALAAFRRAETQFPEGNKLLHARMRAGWCMHRLGRDTDALKLLTTELEKNPSPPENSKIRKMIYRISGIAP